MSFVCRCKTNRCGARWKWVWKLRASTSTSASRTLGLPATAKLRPRPPIIWSAKFRNSTRNFKRCFTCCAIAAARNRTMSTPETILERVALLADEWKLASLQPQIAACRELMQRHNGIDVAVFGRFKAGKSSFLNHLAGRDVLPIGVVPLTAVITRLRFGERDQAEVHFLNGTTKNIPLEQIGRYVGENENPNNEKQVAAVEVELLE